MYQMHKADILQWAAAYRGPKYHAAFMDAPYEMEFMGRAWDNSGVAFNPETWRAIAEHLYPGAWLFVFAGTINDDLISVAMRQAGLRKHHRALAWGFGSGFPKATRIDDKVDRIRGATRRTVGTRKHAPKFDAAGFEYRKKDNGYNSKARQTFDVTEPATDEAAAWAGHRYGQQCIKPAVESILVFQKPYTRAGAVADMLTTGAGALWIDGGRIEGPAWTRNNRPGQNGAFNASGGANASEGGRWPANLLLVHSPRCDADGCADDCAVRALGAQSGEREGRWGKPSPGTRIHDGGAGGSVETQRPGDTGTAARYFFQADYALDRLEAADPVLYCAKASRAEREAGLDPRTVALMRALDDSDEGPAFDEVTVDDGRHTPIDNPYLRGETTRRNPHPTVKPLTLCRHLATLLLPPERYGPRRLLVPFAGVASEVCGALLAGWEHIDGVELDEDDTHIPVANARIAYWLARRAELSDPAKPIAVKAAPAVPAGQIDMFSKEATP